jgi:hypothetical protein
LKPTYVFATTFNTSLAQHDTDEKVTCRRLEFELKTAG